MHKLFAYSWLLTLGTSGLAYAQLSASAYRALGQPDMRQDGVNSVQGLELYAPSGIALDARSGQVHIYVADTNNNRIMAWQDVASYQMGDRPTLILGQPGPQYSNPLGIGAKGLKSPLGLAVDPASGNLYVADTGNNRVLRFPAPFSNPVRVEPDAVYGQPNFTTFNASAVSSSSLSQPRGVAFDSAGNLWVADTGNHRVLRFRAGVLNSPAPPDADLVIGQPDFTSNTANRGRTVSGSSFNLPVALALDARDNLYVSDFNNARVLKFSAPLDATLDPSASSVWGQPNLTTGTSPGQISNSSLAGPAGLAVDAAGTLYVSIPGDNRVLLFPSGSGTATAVLGQSDFGSTLINSGTFPRASASGLFTPSDVKVDAGGNIYIADSGNNRVLALPPNSRSASRVWGQNDFVSNGANQVKPGSLNTPAKIAIDYSQSPYALYVSDTGNHRILVWRDASRFQTGDPADLVIGQPDLRTGIPNVDSQGLQNPSRTSLFFPRGIAVDAAGNLFVADSGNHRVLRYPRPVNQSGRIAPDLVLGQADFTSALSAVVSASSLRSPSDVAIGPDGDIFVADSGNNRVLEFPAGGVRSAAIRVYGQPNFASAAAPALVSAQTLAAPLGVFVDSAFNLYVADTGANRVLVFPNTQGAPPSGMAAAFVIGQDRFDATGGGSGTNLKSPASVSLDSSGNIYVADGGNNRTLIFPSLLFLASAGAKASGVVGQKDLSGTGPNWDSPDGLATPEGLFVPLGIYLDHQDTLYVADYGNNRVLQFLKSAVVVNAAHFLPSVPVAPGSLVSLFGGGLAVDSGSAAAVPLPTSLANRQIVINDSIPSPLLYVGPTQANFQLPVEASIGSDRIAVRLADTGELIAGGNLVVAAASPGLFTTTQDGKGQGIVLNQDKTLNSASSPAPRGSVISLFGTGQGQVSPAVADGAAAPSDTLATTVAVATSDGKACLASQPSLCVAIGSSFGDVQFSGLAPGFVGLWQLNVKIPQDALTGAAVPVRVLINGSASNIVNVAIR